MDRGLSVVEHLSQHGLTTLSDLRTSTGLTNATLLRHLVTLQDRGWIRRNIVEGQYELAHSLGELLGANSRAHPLAELAAPILMEMRQRQLGLPSDLCRIMAPGKIEVIESTRLRGPMAPARTSLGIRPSMVLSAHGRAILAFASPAEFEVHMNALRLSSSRADRILMESGRLFHELEKTRSRGYGLRDADYWVNSAFDPGPDLGAIAVPILSNTGIHGTLSILWLHDDMTLNEVLDLDNLAGMRSAAAKIGTVLDREGFKAPAFSAS